MVDKIILELPADTTGGDILISAEDRAAAVAAAAASEAAAGVASAASATATTKAAEASADAAAAEAAKVAAQAVPTTNDTVMAAVAADTGSAFSAQLSATFVPETRFYSPRRGVVIFSIDDGKAQNIELVEMHESLGQRVTIGITSGWVDTPGYLTSAQVLDLHSRGHELANHSKTHPNYTSISASARATQSDDCSTFIETLTGVRPVTFIYPQGGWNADTEREMYGRFRSWAATVSASTNLPTMYQLGDPRPRWNRIDLDSPSNIERAKEMIRMAAVSPVIVPFYLHQTDQPGVLTFEQYQEIAQYAADMGVPAVLPRDVMGGWQGLADPSFEDPTTLSRVWFRNTTTDDIAYVEASPADGIAGTRVAQFTVPELSKRSLTQVIAVEPGDYILSGRVRKISGNITTNDFEIRMRYRGWDDNPLPLGATANAYPTMPTTGGPWERFEAPFTVPPTAVSVYVEVGLTTSAVSRSGVMQLDHLDWRPARYGALG